MKFLKGLLLTIVGIVILALIIALFLKKDYAVEREVTINKPKSEVFEYIKYVKNQDNYSVWNKIDPASKKTYTGTDGTVGFIYAWNSENKNVGKGEQEITNIKDGERIDMQLRFKEPFEAKDEAYMITEDTGNGQTKVKWGFNGRMAYPMNFMLLFMNMEELLGKSLQDGLNSLKTIMESQK
jgi:uncharacterized protein YndB with AHSA1/START domain